MDDKDRAERQRLERLLRQSPDDTSVLVRLGALVAARFHEPGTAQQILDRALVLDPDSVDARFWLAKVHFHDTVLLEIAVDLLQEALARDPCRADCLSLLASVKRDLDLPVSAYVEDLCRAVALEPTWMIPRIAYAQACMDAGNLDAAERALYAAKASPRTSLLPEGSLAEYHQLITNALRETWKYGGVPPSEAEAVRIMIDVHTRCPIS